MGKRARWVTGCLVWLAVLVFMAGSAQAALKTIKVKSGDTIGKYAREYLGDASLWPKIQAVNPDLKNPHMIYPGQEIKIPVEVAEEVKVKLEKRLVEGEEKADELQGLIARYKAQIAELEAAKEAMAEGEMAAEVVVEEDCTEVKAENARLAEERQDWENEVNRLNVQVEGLREQTREVERRNVKLQGEAIHLEAEIEAMEARMAACQEELALIEGENAELKEVILQLEDKLDDARLPFYILFSIVTLGLLVGI
ncbi:MAG: LysM peptidoglycan-binding domain-containing protein [bacterium]|nr:LysM peptidoglycan-binding domain-containing protein [bacterium]